MGVNQSNQSNNIIGAYSYQLIDQIKEKKPKHLNEELLFNYNSTLLLVNQGFTYHIFQIKSQSLKSLTIIQHSMYSSQLICFKKSNNFLAGSLSKVITSYSLIGINNRKIIYKFNTPIQVNCIILNNAENQIIAGGYEKILILNIQNGLQLYQQFSISNQWITDLSISEFDTYLAINSSQNYILIIEQCLKDTSKIWQEIQKIEIQSNDSKSIFTNNNNLIIKQKDKELLFIYEYNIQDQQFNYVKEFELNGKSHKFSVAPLQFNQQLKILAITNNNNVSFVKIINSDNFELQQILNSKHETIGGAFSQDGAYFALLTQQNYLLLYKLMKM